MRNALKIAGFLAMVLAPLSFGFPAHAQNGASAPAAAPATMGAAPRDADVAGNGDCPERQEFREERERIRAEHEELENEHDRLKAQCMDVKGQDRSDCHDRAQDLHARVDALHERMKTLHAKVEADPGCHHHEHGGGDKAPWPARGGSNGVPAQAPATSP